MIRALFVAHSFPPSPEVGGRRVASFCRYLPDFDIEPIVLTLDERSLSVRDESYPLPEGTRIEQAAELSPHSWFSRVKKRFVCDGARGNNDQPPPPPAASPNHRQSTLARQLAYLADMPDPHLGWYPLAVRTAARVIRREGIEVIFSSGPPWTTHLIARRLKKKYGIPWAADFRDPWADAPHRLQGPRWFSQLHSVMESSCVRLADLVICNTEALRQSFVERYPTIPTAKFVTLTNGFDDVVPTPPESRGPKRTLLHLGDIYGSRRIDTFCQAVRRLVDAGQLDSDRFQILFVGDVAPTAKLVANHVLGDLTGHDCVEFVPRMSWQQAQRLLWSADLLLVFQSGFKTQVPAKFYEYLQTGKPIFAVTAKGALSDLIDLTRSGVWADPEDPALIAAAILRTLDLPPVSPEEVSRRWSGQFHFRSLTAQLAVWIRQLASLRSHPGCRT